MKILKSQHLWMEMMMNLLPLPQHLMLTMKQLLQLVVGVVRAERQALGFGISFPLRHPLLLRAEVLDSSINQA